MGLKKADVLAARLETRELHVDRLDGAVVLREITGAQRSRLLRRYFERSPDGRYVQNEDAIERFTVHLLAMTMLEDGTGELMFDESDESLDQIGGLPADVIDDLSEAALELCGLDAEEGEAPGNA